MDLNLLIHIIIFVIAIVVAIIFIALWYDDRRKGHYMDEEGTLVFVIVLFICYCVILYCSAGFLVIFLNLPDLWEGIFLLIGIFGSISVFFIYAKIVVHLRKKKGQIKFRPKKPEKEECPKCGSLLISGTCRKCGYEWTERKRDKLRKEEELTKLKLQLGRGDISFAEYEQKKKELLEEYHSRGIWVRTEDEVIGELRRMKAEGWKITRKNRSKVLSHLAEKFPEVNSGRLYAFFLLEEEG